MQEDDSKKMLRMSQEITALKSELASVKSALDNSLFYTRIVENLPLNLVCKDREGVLIYANSKYCEQKGLPLSDLVGKTSYDLDTTDFAKNFRYMDEEVILSGQAYTYYEDLSEGAAEHKHAQVIKTPICDDAGDITGVLSLFWDITEFKKIELALRESEKKYRSVIENIQDVFYRTDTSGKLTMVSPSFLKVLGYTSFDQVIGRAMTSFYCNPLEYCNVLRALEKNGKSKEYEATLLKQDGSRVIVSKNSNYYFDSSGKLMGVEGTFRDVTERNQAYEALRKAKREMEIAYIRLQEVDNMKTKFVSMVTHELRTPLTSILGFAEMIRHKLEQHIYPHFTSDSRHEDQILQKIFRDIHIIISESERMSALINDTLDITKLEAGKITWNKQPIDIGETLERAVATTSPLFIGRQVSLIRQVETNLPRVEADEDRIVQVFINLISNALKFTSKGTICCKVKRCDNALQISVNDTGIGIPMSGHERIFDAYTQLGDSLTNKPKGSGLGLSICKQIIEHHGGKIWVKSKESHGSSFIFTLPIADDSNSLTKLDHANSAEEVHNTGRLKLRLVHKKA